MADIKLFHKILIVIALLFGLSKLSKMKFFNQKRRTTRTSTPPRPVYRYVSPPPTSPPQIRREIERKVVRENLINSCDCVARPIMTTDRSREVPCGAAVVLPSESVPSSGGIYLPDEVVRRYYG